MSQHIDKTPRTPNIVPPTSHHDLLGSLLGFDNPRLGQYAELITSLEAERFQKGLPPALSFVEIADPHMQPFEGFLRQINGDLLLDLGGGRCFPGMVSAGQAIAKKYGAATIINVERYPFIGDDRPADIIKAVTYPLQDIASEFGIRPSSSTSRLNQMVVRADMLDFVARVKTASCHVMMNGIDAGVLDKGEFPEYINALLREIARIVKPNGLAFGLKSHLLRGLAQAPGFQTAGPLSSWVDLFIKNAA